MKVVAAAAALLLVVAVPIGATLLIVVVVERPTVPLLTLSLLATLVLTITPVVAAATVVLSPVHTELLEGRRHFRRLAIIWVGIQLVGAIGIVAFAIVEGAPWWLPAVIITAGVVLTAVCSLVGKFLRRREAAAPWMGGRDRGLTRQERNRKVRAVAITCAVTLAVAFAVLTTVGYAIPDEDDDPAGALALALLWGVSFAFLAASIACLVVCWPLIRTLRDHLGPNLKDHRLIRRVVVRGKREELTAEQSERAAKFAVVLSDSFPFQLAQLLFIYVAVLVQQAAILFSSPDSELRGMMIGIGVLLLVVLVVYLPIALRQRRRVRSYAAQHRHLITDPAFDSANGA